MEINHHRRVNNMIGPISARARTYSLHDLDSACVKIARDRREESFFFFFFKDTKIKPHFTAVNLRMTPVHEVDTTLISLFECFQ